MPYFHYTARSGEELIIDKLYAANMEAAREILRGKNLQIVSLYLEERINAVSEGVYIITPQKIILFTRYFSVLLKSGVSAFRALSILEKQERNLKFKYKLSIICQEIENGNSLYTAFGRFPDLFSAAYLNLVLIGEETGKLNEMLDRAIELMERTESLKKKFIASLIYPFIVVVMILAFLIFAVVFVIPKFEILYWQLGLGADALPMLTKVFIKISEFIRANLFYELGLIASIILGIYQVYIIPAGKYMIDAMILKIPLFSILLTKYELAKYTRNLSVMFEAGFSVLKALDRSVGIVFNTVLKKELSTVAVKVESGVALSVAFSETDYMPVMTTEMVLIGEETATFDTMMKNIAEFYERDLDYYLDIMMSLVQPIMVIVLGAIVLLLILAIYLPVFNLASKIS